MDIMENMHGALEDVVILDLTRVVAGPFCTSMLGDMGARIIKIENPKGGDDSRAYGPYVNGESAYFAMHNRSKEGVTLNLKAPEGKALFLEMVKKADVVVENYRPGVMDRLGLGYDVLKEVNDQIIYAAVSGYGCYGRYSQRPGYDILGQAMGGLMSVTGTKESGPVKAGNAMGDILGGLNLTIGILAALHARTIIGHGQRVDVALVDAVVVTSRTYSQDTGIPAWCLSAPATLTPRPRRTMRTRQRTASLLLPAAISISSRSWRTMWPRSRSGSQIRAISTT